MQKSITILALILALALPSQAQAQDAGDPRAWGDHPIKSTEAWVPAEVATLLKEVTAGAGDTSDSSVAAVVINLREQLMEMLKDGGEDDSVTSDYLDYLAALAGEAGAVCRCCGAPLEVKVEGLADALTPKIVQRYVYATNYLKEEWSCGFSFRQMRVMYVWLGPGDRPHGFDASMTPAPHSYQRVQCTVHGGHLIYDDGAGFRPPGVWDNHAVVSREVYPDLFAFAENTDYVLDQDPVQFWEGGDVIPMVIERDENKEDPLDGVEFALICVNGHDQSKICPGWNAFDASGGNDPGCINGFKIIAEFTGDEDNPVMTITKVPCNSGTGGGGGGGGGLDD